MSPGTGATARLIQLADYAEPQSGWFIPMLREAIGAARARGWETEAVFTPIARDQAWLEDLRADGISVRFSPPRSSGLAAWLGDLLGESRSPTLMHTNFTDFDLPALLAARRHSQATVIWHLHTPLPDGLRPVLRNTVKFAMARRRVSRVLCDSPAIAMAARRRGLPRHRLLVLPEQVEAGNGEWRETLLDCYEQAIGELDHRR